MGCCPFCFLQIEIAHKYSTVDTLRQQYLFIPAKYKDCYLAFVLNELSGSTAMVRMRDVLRPQRTTEALDWWPSLAPPSSPEGTSSSTHSSSLVFHPPKPVLTILWSDWYRANMCPLPARALLLLLPQVFTRTCDSTRKIALTLRNLGFGSVPIHGQMSQPKRLGALNKFKGGERSILVATDVASRGLDIPSVDVVINYDVPANSKDYVHRVGRTARAGRSGRSVTLVTQYDVEMFQKIEHLTGVKMEAFPAERDEVLLLLEQVSNAQRIATMQMKEADEGGRGGKGKKRGHMGDDEEDASLASLALKGGGSGGGAKRGRGGHGSRGRARGR